MRLTLLAAAVTAIGGMQGCATPQPPAYGPIGEAAPFGYKDWLNPDGAHTLLVVMPAHSTLVDARSFWDRRAGELCPDGVTKRNVFRADRKEFLARAGYVYGGVGIGSRMGAGFEVEGYVYCKSALPGP